MHRKRLAPVVLVLLAVAASVAMALVALDLAAGVTRPGGRCCETEFIDERTLGFRWLLFPVLALAAFWSWRLALVGVLAITVAQWLAMAEVMDRYAESRWSSGLEVLGYLVPIQTALVGTVAVVAGALVGALASRPRRRRCRFRRREGQL